MLKIIKFIAVVGAVLTAPLAIAADDAPAPKKKWQYTSEEFGVGRKHTPNDKCNQDIDKLLQELLACYNAQEASKCEDLQEKNWKKIGDIKKHRRCRK